MNLVKECNTMIFINYVLQSQPEDNNSASLYSQNQITEWYTLHYITLLTHVGPNEMRNQFAHGQP